MLNKALLDLLSDDAFDCSYTAWSTHLREPSSSFYHETAYVPFSKAFAKE